MYYLSRIIYFIIFSIFTCSNTYQKLLENIAIECVKIPKLQIHSISNFDTNVFKVLIHNYVLKFLQLKKKKKQSYSPLHRP